MGLDEKQKRQELQASFWRTPKKLWPQKISTEKENVQEKETGIFFFFFFFPKKMGIWEIPVGVTGAWETEIPRHDFTGYISIDDTLAMDFSILSLSLFFRLTSRYLV